MAGRKRCYLRAFANSECSGRLQRVHLVKEQTIRREVWDRRLELEAARAAVPRSKRALLKDPRWWVWGCLWHHHQLDKSRKLRIPRHRLPPELEQAAAEYGILWWLDREYGCRS